MTVRRATAADAGALAALRRSWVEEEAGRIDDGEAFEQEFAQWYAAEAGRRLTWVAAFGAETVGMLNLVEFHRMPRPGRLHSAWGYISNVFVLAAHRDGGIGRELLDAAISAARERGYARLVLSPSERARPLYRRVGFGAAEELMLMPLSDPRSTAVEPGAG
jgi:GNAT superfamily N-acetyltransferase